jgi:hypothetical protein
MDMENDSMPGELVELERRLAGRRVAGGDAAGVGMRQRVLAAVAGELARQERGRGRAWLSAMGEWGWPMGAAAALFVLYLSMTSASQDAFSIRPAGDAQQMVAELQVIGALEAQQEGASK